MNLQITLRKSSLQITLLAFINNADCPNRLFFRQTSIYFRIADIIYEEFITLPGSRQNGTEFHLGQPGSCNHKLSQLYVNDKMRKQMKKINKCFFKLRCVESIKYMI